jgi:RsiW-degrading membrane proteinase PrsW (M82 family)
MAKIHWPSLVQCGLSLAVGAGLLALGSLLALLGVWIKLSRTALIDDPSQLMLIAAGLALSGALLLPSAFYAFERLQGRRHLAPPSRPASLWLLLALAPVFLLGQRLAQEPELAWIWLPLLQPLAIGLPILWLVLLARRGLPIGSRQRAWGILASGLALSPALILLTECLLLFSGVLLLALHSARQPGLTEQLNHLLNRLMVTANHPTLMQRLLSSYLSQPGTIYLLLVSVAVVVPLIEEALKPLAVWLLIGSRLTPAAGFSAGIISGAGYALIENLLFSAQTQDWALLALTRSGTAAMHILSAGLTGWALACLWQPRRPPGRAYLRLGTAYLSAVLLHALWNACAVFIALGQFLPDRASLQPWLNRLIQAAPFGLACLALGILISLFIDNLALQRKSSQRAGSGVLHGLDKNLNRPVSTPG